jgi:FkbM family methyltransferase
MGEYVFSTSYVVRQALSGHSLASDFIRKAFYDAPGERERNFFADAFAKMVEASQGQDPSGLFRDVLIWDAGGRPSAFDVDLSNGQFMGAARFVEPFRWGYEPEILAMLALFLRTDDVLFDIGSNWGYFCWHVLLDPDFRGSVVAFEPSRQSFRDLARICRFAKLGERMRHLEVALGDSRAVMTLSDDTWSGNRTLSAQPESGELVRVETLDSFNLPDPSFIKLDVENFEAQTLRGGRALIERASPMIVFENWLGSSPEAVQGPFCVLSMLGYRFFLPVFRPLSDFSESLPSRVEGSLVLREFLPEERNSFAERINVFACPPSRLDQVGSAMS